MAAPNPQLQAVIAQFAQQPGVSPDQVAQLRATITADAGLMKGLNQAASNHQLQGFALPPSGASANIAGTYDKASGVVTLPASSFQSGTAASPGLRGTLHLQEMGVRFAHSTYLDASKAVQPVTQDMVTNLQATINSSPVLAAEMKRAATTVDPTEKKQDRMLLENFAPLSGTVAGGTYNGDTRTMSLPPSSLAQPPAIFQQKRAIDLTFVLGHETQHAFNHPGKMAAYKAFDTAAMVIAQDKNPVNDYTLPVDALIGAGREDEAKAQLSGWNALLSRTQQTIPAANLTDMMKLPNSRIKDFVEVDPANSQQAQARPLMTFNPIDATVAITPGNIEAQGQYYFDKPPTGTPGALPQQTTGIGFHGDSDYRNYYGAGAVSRAIHFERNYAHPVNSVAPQMQLDMAQLRLREDLLEHNGITLPSNTGTPQPYMDISTNPPTAGLFEHTAVTHLHTSPISAHPLEVTPSSPTLSTPRSRADDPDNPDHDLLEKIKGGVRGLDQQAGKSWDDQSERISASLLTLAAEKKFSAQDDLKIAFNKATPELAAGEVVHVFRVGHPSPDPAAHRAYMTTAEALSAPPADRLQQVEAIRQTQTETAQLEQQQALTRSAGEPANAGPKMQM